MAADGDYQNAHLASSSLRPRMVLMNIKKIFK
jgi:hypothetical protein